MKNILHGNGSLGRKIQYLLLMTLFVVQSALSFAQNRTVTGVVVDEKDEPIIGANVTVKGTAKGTITDLDGKFVLSAPKSAKLLEVSFIGYNTQTVTITDKTLQIKLSESAIALDEVVAIGYGSDRSYLQSKCRKAGRPGINQYRFFPARTTGGCGSSQHHR